MTIKTFETKLKEKKKEMRTFKEGTTLGKMQEQIAELFLRIEQLEGA